MVEVIQKSRDFSEVEVYLMTIAPNMMQMKNLADGEKITIDGYLLFNDTKEDGSSTEVLSVITPDKKVYACQSATFKRSVYDICKIFGNKPVTVVKMSGKTKAGRDYINCYLDIDSVE